MDCSPPGSSVHGIFQARVLEWGAIAFSEWISYMHIYIPSLWSLPPTHPPQSHPSRPSQSTKLSSLRSTAASPQLSISHRVVYIGQRCSQFLLGPCLLISLSEHRPGRDLLPSLPSFPLPHPQSPHAQVPGTCPRCSPFPFSPPKTPTAPWFCFCTVVTRPLFLLKSSFLIVALIPSSLSGPELPPQLHLPPIQGTFHYLHTSLYLTFPRQFSLSLPWLSSAFGVLFTVLDLWKFYDFLKLCRVLTAFPL